MIRGYVAECRQGLPHPATKAAALVSLIALNPMELYDRVRAKVEVTNRKRRPARTRYQPIGWSSLARQFGGVLDSDISGAYEVEFAEVRERLAERARGLPPAPFPAMFDADPLLARLAYTLARTLRPEIVVETGVALGVVSSCILAALERNGSGRLISIDLPPLGVSPRAVGQIIPEELRARWTLVPGSSTRLLPRILAKVAPVGLFVQDSLFTWRNSTQEYSQVLPHLAPSSAIVANCIQHSHAFAWLLEQSRPSVHAAVAAEQKANELIGVWVRADSRSSRSSPAA